MSEEVTYTKEEFEALPPADQNNVLMGKIIIKGKGVVRRADGSIKYDDESKIGTFGEENLK